MCDICHILHWIKMVSWRWQSVKAYHSVSQAMYLAAIVILCLITVVLTMAERFATPSFRPLRAGLFVALGCFGILPVSIHPKCLFTSEWRKCLNLFSTICHISFFIQFLHFASLEGWSAVSSQVSTNQCCLFVLTFKKLNQTVATRHYVANGRDLYLWCHPLCSQVSLAQHLFIFS